MLVSGLIAGAIEDARTGVPVALTYLVAVVVMGAIGLMLTDPAHFS